MQHFTVEPWAGAAHAMALEGQKPQSPTTQTSQLGNTPISKRHKVATILSRVCEFNFAKASLCFIQFIKQEFKP
jgi:hypothetical protein